MAGVKGQPAPKPSQLKAAPEGSALDSFVDSLPKGSALDNFDPNTPEQPAATQQFESPWYTSMLPTAGAMIGGVAGTAAGPAGVVGGAALGGAAGKAYQDLIETQLMGKPQASGGQVATDIAQAGALEGAGQAAGMGIVKSASKIASIPAVKKLGEKALGIVSEMAEAPLRFIKGEADLVKQTIVKPVVDILAPKVSTVDPLEAGNMVKQLLNQNIQQKYGPFIQAYSDLDQIAKAQPISDEARVKFTNRVRDWALELGGDRYRTAKKFLNNIDAADNGMQMDEAIKTISDAQTVAMRSGATNQAHFLGQLRRMADDFLEGETTKLAARIQAGKATPQETAFLQHLAQSRGIVEPDPTKYAKSIAKDYLSARDKITQDYAGFRSFLEDIGEQTKVGAVRKGPKAFMQAIEDVPSEKLMERMFDPKNAAALHRMQRETPEVFDQVVKTKMSQLMQKASPTGNLDNLADLDFAALQRSIKDLPPATRNLLMKSDEWEALNKVIANPKLARLAATQNRMEKHAINYVADLVDVAGLTARGAGKGLARAVSTAPGQLMMGKGAIEAGQGLAGSVSPGDAP